MFEANAAATVCHLELLEVEIKGRDAKGAVTVEHPPFGERIRVSYDA